MWFGLRLAQHTLRVVALRDAGGRPGAAELAGVRLNWRLVGIGLPQVMLATDRVLCTLVHHGAVILWETAKIIS